MLSLKQWSIACRDAKELKLQFFLLITVVVQVKPLAHSESWPGQ